MPSLLDTFRALASFSPPRIELHDAPWDDYVDWAIAQGLGPLAAYNLEYRLAGGGAPQWVRDRLLSTYQGSANDNVMRLVAFKRCVDDLEGRQLVLFGGASYAESLYPHVAFRPVLDVQVLVRPEDLDGFTGFLRQSGFHPPPSQEELGIARRFLTDGHTGVLLYSGLLGESRWPQEENALRRALPMKVYGPSVFRLDLEDAILMTCLEHARAGYEVPALSFVDLRELVQGAPSTGGVYSRAISANDLLTRAKEWKLERALYTSLSIVARLFPEASPAVQRVLPSLRGGTRQLLDRLVISPVAQVGKTKVLRGSTRLRRLLAGE